MGEERKHSAVVLGGSGAIGRPLVVQLIQSPAFERVTALLRRELKFSEEEEKSFPEGAKEKFTQVIVDFEKLSSYADSVTGHDSAFCCLGTTRKDAGSAEAFRKVDYDYNLSFATMCKQAGVETFMLVSSVGANAGSLFLYMRVKGEIEDAIRNLGFRVYGIMRPGLLDRGENSRFIEKVGLFFSSGMPVARVAQAMRRLVETAAQSEATRAYDNDGINASANL